jgi:hypothetical protein
VAGGIGLRDDADNPDLRMRGAVTLCRPVPPHP